MSENLVVNISKKVLNSGQLEMLNRGLSFIPTNNTTLFEEKICFHRLLKKLRLKIFFESDENLENRQSEGETLEIRPKSNFDPHIQNSILNLFEKKVITDLKRINYQISTPINVKKCQLDHVEALARDESLTIKPADKGGAIVVMDTDDYTRKCLSLLNEVDTYTKLNGDPIVRIRSLIEEIIEQALDNKWISCKTSEFLINQHPITPVFYGLPKIHKNQNDPPLRPIVAGTDSIFDPLSIYIDRLLQPLIQNIPTYLKDTTDFLNCIQEVRALSPDCILFSMDVCSLYTSIPHVEGIQAVEWLLLNSQATRGDPELIVKFLSLILNNNYFRFQGNFYLQVTGTSMGSAMAPVYANTFMYRFEHRHALENENWSSRILLWKRYIDDIFGIWCGTKDEFTSFFNFLNSVHQNIKFTMEIGTPSLHFLDVIATNVYHKPTDVNNLLHFSSFHPKSMLSSLPYSQILRLKRIVSDPEGFDVECTKLLDKFEKRGYPQPVLEEAKERSSKVSKEQLLTPKIKNKETPLLYISKYSRQSFQVGRAIKKHWSILQNDPLLERLFPKYPMMAFKRGQNLRDKLVRAEKPPKDKQTFLQTKKKGTFPCLGCSHCNNVIKGENISHPLTGKKFKLRDYATCMSTGVIYSIKCPCGKLYVGQTTRAVKERITEHKSNIRCKNTKSPLARHFMEHHHTVAQIKFQVLEVVKKPHRGGDYQSILSRRETFWIHQLDTLNPQGLNEEFSLRCFI
ncbi:uncharacterized protein [Ambystoma mexicanum]|uniref:uncharacterized protein n=1 Tax=Ambystoma mexicanum TaxID=8296 RepID=UPI0037E938DC